MRKLGWTTGWALGMACGLTVGAAAAAGHLPKLPEDVVLSAAADSPGPVTFSHESHVDLEHPDCTTCHPALFRIVPDASHPSGPVTHEAMEAGHQCGACHDGTSATGLDECDHCHGE